MYRVVLIDNASAIVEYLCEDMNWADYGCEVVGTAGDAAEGERWIRQLRPHILIAEIQLPDENSLSMVARLREEFPDMQVTLLTRCRDFDCAREAIRLGVTRYLLKPCAVEEIREALLAMIRKLDALPREVQAERGKNAGGFIVTKAVRYIEENYSRKLTLQEVADCCYVSPWHLSKQLNQHGGKSFYEILNLVRIRAAKKLLEDPSLKIGEISEMVGYADAAHFARIFKRLENMSANAYRNSMKK